MAREQPSNVVEGTIEPDHRFPWVVTVAGTLTGKGVLIAPTWVLTAAHNVETSFGGARISYSRIDRNGRATARTQTTLPGSVKVHPGYGTTGNPSFDLALVRLPVAFPSDPLLRPAALPGAPAVVGQVGTIASFSHTMMLPPGHVAVLRGPITIAGGLTFEASSPTASLCEGDSGSGFISSNGSDVVVGIATRTHTGDCTQPNMPFEAVDVFSHLSWIRSTAGLFNAEFLTTNGQGGTALLRGHGDWRSSWDIIIPGNFGGNAKTDLLFYDRTEGTGEFCTADGSGGIRLLRAQPNWRKSWDIIVPGDFGGDGHTDLLFYDQEAGTGQFHATDGGGGIHELRTHADFRSSWDIIVPGDFGGDGHTDLLFYDRRAGTGEFYTSDGSGGIRLLRAHTNWRTSWDIIVPGKFGGDDHTDLLFYDRTARQGEFYKTNGLGGIVRLRRYDGWRDTWNAIVAGDFAGGSASDLLFYDRAAGLGEFYRNNGEANFSHLRTIDDWRTTWFQIVAGHFGDNNRTDLLFYEGAT